MTGAARGLMGGQWVALLDDKDRDICSKSAYPQ